jgi:hypothetical protein
MLPDVDPYVPNLSTMAVLHANYLLLAGVSIYPEDLTDSISIISVRNEPLFGH